MFGLPEATYFGKLVPKNKFYNHLTVDKKLERSFIEQINSIRWMHKLSAGILNVEKGNTVEEIEVFLISLKTCEIPVDVLKQLDKELHYHLIFVLESDGQYQIWTSYKEESVNTAFKVGNYYHTDWITEDSFSLSLDGLNMDTIYENLVRQIAGSELEKENNESLKETVERQMEREKLEKEIERLRARIRKEKQFNRQVELNKELKTLIKKLGEI